MIGKRQEIEKWMEKKKIDLLCIQETKINCNASESRHGFTWYFSSSVKDADRDKANKLKNCNKKVPVQLQEKSGNTEEWDSYAAKNWTSILKKSPRTIAITSRSA